MTPETRDSLALESSVQHNIGLTKAVDEKIANLTEVVNGKEDKPA